MASKPPYVEPGSTALLRPGDRSHAKFQPRSRPSRAGPFEKGTSVGSVMDGCLNFDPVLGRSCHQPRWIIAVKASVSAFSSELGLMVLAFGPTRGCVLLLPQ